MSFIIKKPLIKTEKNAMLAQEGCYAFEVDRRATKIDVKREIEKHFEVKVKSVKTCICRGRAKKTRHGLGKVRYWKKAFVKLVPGEKISIFEGA